VRPDKSLILMGFSREDVERRGTSFNGIK